MQVRRWWTRFPQMLVVVGLLAAAYSMYGGGARRASLGISAQEAPLYPGPCSTAPSNVSITFKGPLSGCTPNNGKACSAQEAIEFTAVSPSYSFATCDKFAWNFGDGGAVTTLMNGTSHQFTPGKTRTVTLTVTNDFGTTRAASTLDIPLAGGTSCSANANTLCFVNNRYQVTLDAADVPARSSKTAIGEANVQTPDTGYFTLSGLTSSTQNPEVVVKVLEVPASFVPAGAPPSWVFFGGLTDLEYFVNVLDTTTGQVRQYHKFPGTVQNGFDTGGGQLPAIETAPGQICPQTPQVTVGTEAPSTCTPGANQLCLVGNRFKVTLNATNRNPGADLGKQAPGVTVPKNDLFGFFSIPGLTGNPNNLEAFVKILDARVINQKFWIFFGTLTNFELSVTVTDVTTGQKKTYSRSGASPNNACGAADTAAFPF